MQNQNTLSIKVVAIAFAAFVFVLLPIGKAQAADYSDYDYVGTSYYDYPTYDYVGTSYYTPSSDYDYVGSTYYNSPNYSTPSYSTPSYSYPTYSASSYSYPSYSYPTYSTSNYSYPSYSYPSYSTGGSTSGSSSNSDSESNSNSNSDSNSNSNSDSNSDSNSESNSSANQEQNQTQNQTQSTNVSNTNNNQNTNTTNSNATSQNTNNNNSNATSNVTVNANPNITVNVPATSVVVNVPTPVVYNTYNNYLPGYQQPTYYNYAPTCTLTASQTYFPYSYQNAAQPVTISWSSSNANSGSISNFGSVALSGSRVVYLNTTTTFTGTFWGQNGQSTNCSVTVSFGTYFPTYPTTPYITLSQVPYTGLDLGPVGTAVYWGFLVLWSLFAAYLIAVKKVHIAVARNLKNFLFGTSTAPVVSTAVTSSSDLEVIVNTVRAILEGAPSASRTAPASASTKTTDGTDSFIMAQINRPRHA